MSEPPEHIDLALKILGRAFATALTNDTGDDEVARAFDVVCQVVTKRMSEGQQATVDSFIGLDIARPWETFDDADDYRRPVDERRKRPADSLKA